QVDGDRQADIGDILSALFLNQLFQLAQVNIALKGDVQACIMGLVSDDIDKDSTIGLLMVPGGGKVHIPRDILPRLNSNSGQQVLGAAPLMGGDQEGKAENLPDRFLQMLKVL